MEAVKALIEHAAYMPHGYCLLWKPWLVVLYSGSDFLIFLAYCAIPVALIMFLKQRPDVKHRGLVALFAAFILLCGLTHLVSILTLWLPVYPLHGVVKLITGIVSLTTAAVLFFLLPKLVAIPSPRQLEIANEKLMMEIDAHNVTMEELREVQKGLESKVEQRTAELSRANEKLAVAAREAVHRGKNLLAVVQSIARETSRHQTDTKSFLNVLHGRLQALSAATSSIIETAKDTSAPVRAIVKTQLAPLLLMYKDRIMLRGPAVDVRADAVHQLGLAFHELATNAQKYGALANDTGTIEIDWRVVEEAGEKHVIFRWREAGGPNADKLVLKGGFGTKLLEQVIPEMLAGRARREIVDGGLNYELIVPLSALSPAEEKTLDIDAASELTDRLYGPPAPA